MEAMIGIGTTATGEEGTEEVVLGEAATGAGTGIAIVIATGTATIAVVMARLLRPQHLLLP